MKLRTTISLLALLFAFALFGQDFSGMKYNFNSAWLLQIGDDSRYLNPKFDDSKWKKITLPRPFNEGQAFSVSIAEHTDTVVWYRKHFRLSAADKGKKVFLEFEGIRFGGRFYINGHYLGLHENGVMASGFDISDFVGFGNEDNVVAVRIDNSWKYREESTGQNYQWNDRNFYANYGGIPKNVYLHVKNRLYQTLPLYSNLGTTGVYVYAREIDITRRAAMVYAESEIKNEYTADKEFVYEVKIQELDGKNIATFTSKPLKIKAGETLMAKTGGKVENLHFWSWGYGYLYNVITTIKCQGTADIVKTRTGFRKTRFANGMFWLNDRVLQIKGYAERTTNEWPAVGQSVPPWLSDYSNRLMVESGGNTVRWMHVTPWKQDVESCDRVGLIQLMPAGDSEKDVAGRRWEQRMELMRDAIIYNRNNPSIIFYEGGNESISEEHIAEIKALRDKYDPYGGRAVGSREMLDSKISEWGGEMLYINKSAHIPMFATEYCRDEGLRLYWDDYSFPYHKNGEGGRYVPNISDPPSSTSTDFRAYNHNQDSFFKELITRWWDYFRVRPGTGTRVSSGGLKIHFHESNTHWRGAENYRRSGVVDAMRVPKDAFFAHQVMWNGWVDTEKHGTYICGHWNYEAEQPLTKEVLVCSTGDSVVLLVNNAKYADFERDAGFLFTFKNVKYEAGKIEAVSYDKNGKELSRYVKETAGKPAYIKLTPMFAPDGFKADGADLALIEVEVVDKEGRRCPVDNSLFSFTLEGEAEWRGGIAHGKEGNYVLETALPVECGVNRVLIRSTSKAGKIRLTASANLGGNLEKTASIEFSSIPFETKNGLSDYISGDYQPVNLSRGETPKGESFSVKRSAIEIVGATAGCNEADAAKSFDDNELSEWKNDGRLASGWIKYELARDAVVNQVEMKLTGWRMRSYPIQIFVDDTKVYEGETEKSLGYVCISFPPAKGRFVTVKLVGQSSESDAFGGIVEVAAPQAGELDLFKAPNGGETRNELRIVEAEVYGY
ncbi:MAG: DUF4982 domain-containing protein [Dysgonamonadaceae bacterium]|jgi:hypothetical protein|nr:DUF4982 domain-containing protein [Dysgonamonadaceae bacterium]